MRSFPSMASRCAISGTPRSDCLTRSATTAMRAIGARRGWTRARSHASPLPIRTSVTLTEPVRSTWSRFRVLAARRAGACSMPCDARWRLPEEAGLEPGDVVVALDGTPVRSFSEFRTTWMRVPTRRSLVARATRRQRVLAPRAHGQRHERRQADRPPDDRAVRKISSSSCPKAMKVRAEPRRRSRSLGTPSPRPGR